MLRILCSASDNRIVPGFITVLAVRIETHTRWAAPEVQLKENLPMKPRIVTNAQNARHHTLFGNTRARRLVRGGAFLIVAALVALPFYSASSSSLGTHKIVATSSTARLLTEASNASANRALSRVSKYLALPMPPPVESIATYDSTCTNPKV